MRFRTEACKRVVRHIAERLIHIHVAGDVRIELAAGVAGAGSRPVDVDAHVDVDAVRAHVSDLRDQGGREFVLRR